MDIAKHLIAFVAVMNYGGLVADALVPATARQHLYNPHWPPHAKFHNAQTMLMGIFSATLALILLFGPGPLTLARFLVAAVVAANYFVAMALAPPLFPGNAWFYPEFAAETPRPLRLAPQQLIAYALCAVVAIAVGLALASR